MGVGQLPWRAIRAWADEHSIATGDDFDDFAALMLHLDGLWLKHRASKLPTPGKEG